MTREELKSATGQELIDQRNYCGVDGYYGDYLDNVNEEMLNRFNRLAELEAYNEKLLDGDIEKHNKIVILEKENAELKEVHESDKRSLRLIAEKGAKLEKELKAEKEYNATLRKEIDEYTSSHTLCVKYKELEKAYNETEELLDKQIEATYKLFEENKELKADNKALREKVHWWKKEVNVAHRARADEFEKLVIENKVLKRKLTYAKTIIQDLLDNTDEYARQRAEDFLKECE